MSHFDQKRQEFLAIFNKLYELDEALHDDLGFLYEAVNNEVTIEPSIERAVIEAKKLEYEADAIKSFIDDLKSRHDRKKSAAQSIRQAVGDFLEEIGVNKLSTPIVTLTMRQNQPKTIITDEDALPDEFVEMVRRPNTAKIKKALQSGQPVNGAVLSNGSQSLSVRVK
jgi:hypothetical protein